MEKIESIMRMADLVLNSNNKVISPNELDVLLSNAKNQTEKDLYITLYNFFLDKKSEEVIKNGKF